MAPGHVARKSVLKGDGGDVMQNAKYWENEIKKKTIDNERIKNKFASSDPFVMRIRNFLIDSNNEAIDVMQQFAGDKKK